MKSLASFLALPGGDRRLLMRAVLMLILVRAALHLVPIVRLRDWTGRMRPGNNRPAGRIKKVIGIVESYKPEQLEGAETREIVIKIPSSELKFNGVDYVTAWVMPNFYFHLTTAYAILRHNGIELGKRDFLMA